MSLRSIENDVPERTSSQNGHINDDEGVSKISASGINGDIGGNWKGVMVRGGGSLVKLMGNG